MRSLFLLFAVSSLCYSFSLEDCFILHSAVLFLCISSFFVTSPVYFLTCFDCLHNVTLTQLAWISMKKSPDNAERFTLNYHFSSQREINHFCLRIAIDLKAVIMLNVFFCLSAQSKKPTTMWFPFPALPSSPTWFRWPRYHTEYGVKNLYLIACFYTSVCQ